MMATLITMGAYARLQAIAPALPACQCVHSMAQLHACLQHRGCLVAPARVVLNYLNAVTARLSATCVVVTTGTACPMVDRLLRRLHQTQQNFVELDATALADRELVQAIRALLPTPAGG